MSNGKRSRIGSVILLLATPVACGDGGIVDPALEERLYGSWEWLSAEGGLAGGVRTPESEGFTRRLVFTRPNRVELFRDGVPEAETTFELVPAPELGDEFVPPRVRYAEPIFGFDEQEVGFDLEGRLILTDPCCDGFVYTWARIAPEG